MKLLLPVAVVVMLTSCAAFAQAPDSAASIAEDDVDWWETDTLTNNWFSLGPAMREHGIRLAASAAYFEQKMVIGDGDMSTALGGKLDALLNVNLHKLGLWSGLSMLAHGEYTFGESSNGVGGTLLPVNTALQVPGTKQNQFDITSLVIAQRFNETFSLVVGKTNLADIAALHPFAGGLGLTRFMNAGLVAAPSGAKPTHLYAATLSATTKWATFSLGGYGGTSALHEMNFTDAFDQGWLMAATITVPVKPFGLPGNQTFNVLWGNREPPTEGQISDFFLEAIGLPTTLDTTRLVFTYAFDQFLVKWGEGRNDGWGIWGRAVVADDSITAIAWSVVGGIGGTSTIPGRGLDRWGIGGFYYSVANYLKTPITGLEDEHGIECFYAVAVTPWLRVTPDLQIINPGVGNRDTAVFVALRTVVRF